MKVGVTLGIIGLLLICSVFMVSASITTKAIDYNNDSNDEINSNAGSDDNSDTSNIEDENETEDDSDNSIISAREDESTLREKARERLREANKERIKEAIKERNRLRFENRTGAECPESCTCTGSTIKCMLANGREMTIIAGNSGNTIVQVKGENMSTKVILYKANDGKIYGVFKNNETRIVRMLPDQIKEKLRERTLKILENENITLDENGTYQYEARKKSRLFLIIPIKVRVNAEVDAETGEIIRTSKPNWWEFLVKDDEDLIVGASCGTVSPDSRNECCQTKAYDAWDNTAGECIFSS